MLTRFVPSTLTGRIQFHIGLVVVIVVALAALLLYPTYSHTPGAIMYLLAGAGVALAAALVMLAWLMRRQVLTPLQQLSSSLAQVAEGQLDADWDSPASSPEIAQLADNLKAMSLRLREREEALGKHAHELEHEIIERKMSEERMQHMATHDALTGLANRALLMERLQQTVASAERTRQDVAVLFIDLDHFKQVNDTLGHNTGDEVLKEVADKVLTQLRKSDTLCRIGGDEFVLLLPTLAHRGDASAIAQKIITVLSVPLEIGGVSFALTPSIGIATYPSDGKDAATLLNNADIAMYHAKAAGRNGFEIYTPDMGLRAREGLPLEAAIRDGIENNEFVLYFQPKVDARSQKIVSAEALIRWTRPGYGLLSPAAFIPFAESRLLMRTIDQFVLRRACETLQRWNEQGYNISLAVNLSGSEFNRAELVGEINALLKRHDLLGKQLILEVTEGVFLKNAEVVVSNLGALRQLGVKISIDDFGTGYSSLSYLHRFPVDELKIDRSFINAIGGTEKETALVRAIIGIGRDLTLNVVAEGVETQEQLSYLNAHDCNVLQGYYLGMPLPEEQFLESLDAQRFAATC